jgi:repressor LexA
MKNLKKLSRAKQRLVDYLMEYQAVNEVYPTYQEICDYLDIKSRSTIHFHLEDLMVMGWVEKRVDGSIFAVHEPEEQLEKPLVKTITSKAKGKSKNTKPVKKTTVKLMGSIAASPPREAFEVMEEIEVPDTFVSRKFEVFALEVRGPSMVDEGIHDGDMVFIRRQPTANHGQIVAVSINGETTLKRMRTKSGQLIFVPANRSMSPIMVNEGDDVQILGVLEGFFHRVLN